ncbi:MAG: diguanylate cyclase [Chitinispirillales bacterium]|jgi:diguanylate cyclase (GGDEF)-like protein|nr:diguanylate cyclase [Chitinispirillales bacterium]
MSNDTGKNFEYRILVVDDDTDICDLLSGVLSTRYDITVCFSGKEAIEHLDKDTFDLVIADLVLPDVSGIDILAHAKSRDEFAEVLMITGNASVDTAAAAINGGAGSYMLKPFSIRELCGRVDKMIATRQFLTKSLRLMSSSDIVDPAVKEHIDDITTLYHFTCKLMLTLDVSEMMRIVLEEVNRKIGAEFCSIEINHLGYKEVFSMPRTGLVGKELLDKVFAEHWNSAFICTARAIFFKGAVPHRVFDGRHGNFSEASGYTCRNYRLVVPGKTIGSLSVWLASDNGIDDRFDRHLHVLTSIASPVIEHVYADKLALLQAKTDGLTGISNKRHFYEALGREIARANRKKNTFALVLADIDNFKIINDTHGHQIGDAVLIELTKHLTDNVRVGDVVARYGGEEFVLILPDTDLEGAVALANRIRESIASTPFANAKYCVPYTSSFGLAMYDGAAPVSKDDLIVIADTALYYSKHHGKNRVTVGEDRAGAGIVCKDTK